MKRTLLPFLILATIALTSVRTESQEPNRYSVPLVITPTITPLPNKHGWNNTSVIIHFAITNTAPSEAWVTPDVFLTSETNDAKVVGIAFDRADNSNVSYVVVNIDKTFPTLVLKAGNGQTFDDSYPLLVIDYSDKSAAGTFVKPSGLKLDSLRTTLDGRQVTNLFYRFSNRALAMVKHLPAGEHTWVASIADVAGNVTTVSNVFTATGTVNSNAPTMSNLNLLDDVTMTPDWSQVWVQGKVSGQRSTVSASMNGGESIPMNRREDIFGFFLDMDPGTNVIVLVASDTEGRNRSAQLLRVERSEKFSLDLTSPTFKFGRFANGHAQAAKGNVSYRFAEGEINQLTLASLKVNGMAASISGPSSNGNVSWDGVMLPAPGCTNSVMPIIVSLCWTGRLASSDYTNLWMNVPLLFVEASEIVQRKSSYAESWLAGEYPNQSFEEGKACGIDQWIRADYGFGWDTEFNLPCSGHGNSVTTFFESDWPWPWTCSREEPACEDATSEQHLHRKAPERLSQSDRGLSFGSWGWQIKYTRHALGDAVVFLYGLQVVEEGSLTFRTPFELEHHYADIFTFKAVEGVALSNLTFEGNSPIAWDDAKRTVTYLLYLDGGSEYTISQESFGWPASGTNTFAEYKEDDAPPPGKHFEWYREEFHTFRFSDFDQ